MKKVLVFSLLMIIVLSGCSQKNDNSSQAEGKSQEVNSENIKRPGVPDFERPEEEPSLRGLVKAVVGNEVTILELAMPDRDKVMDGEGDADNNQVEEKAPTATFGTGTGMRSGRGMGGGDRDNVDEDARLEMMKSMATGEAKVIIPVGIKMLKNEDGEMVNATLTDVSSNKILMIWLNKNIEDKNIAEFVIIN